MNAPRVGRARTSSLLCALLAGLLAPGPTALRGVGGLGVARAQHSSPLQRLGNRLDPALGLVSDGRFAEALESLDTLERDEPKATEIAFVQILRLRCLLRVGRTREALGVSAIAENLARQEGESDFVTHAQAFGRTALDIVRRVTRMREVESLDGLRAEVEAWPPRQEDGRLDLERARAEALFRLGAYDVAEAEWHRLAGIAEQERIPWLVDEARLQARRADAASSGAGLLETLRRTAEGDAEAAWAAWLAATEQGPFLTSWAEAQIFAAGLLRELGRSRDAIAMLKSLTNDGQWVVSDRIALLVELADIAERAGEVLEAISALDRAIQRAQEFGDASLKNRLSDRRRRLHGTLGHVRVICLDSGEHEQPPWHANPPVQVQLSGVRGLRGCGEAWDQVPPGLLLLSASTRADGDRTTTAFTLKPDGLIDARLSPPRTFGDLPWYLVGGASLALAGAGGAYLMFQSVEGDRSDNYDEAVAFEKGWEAANGRQLREDEVEEVLGRYLQRETELKDDLDLWEGVFFGFVGVSSALSISAIALLLLESDAPQVTVGLGRVSISATF